MKQYPFWRNAISRTTNFPALEGDITVAVCIIGGGITGITLARKLADNGANVCLVEAEKIGSGTTGYSSGNLYAPVDTHISHLIDKYNEEKIKKVLLSRQGAVDLIIDWVSRYEIPCELEPQPWYYFTEHDNGVQKINNEAEALIKTGLDAEILDTVSLPFPIKKAVKVDNQARFNPLTYVMTLANTLENSSCNIYEDTRVLNVKEQDDICVIETSGGKIHAGIVIMATHLPLGFNVLQTESIPYRSYVYACHLKDSNYPYGVFWDTEDPYHAISTHAVGEEKLLVVAGGDHKTGQSADHELHYRQLEEYVSKRFKAGPLAYRWSAQHYRPVDGLPYIGRSPFSNGMVYTATGFSGDGLTYGTLAAQIICDIIQGKKNPYANLYDASRVSLLQSVGQFLKENANVAAHYVRDYIGSSDVHALKEIPKGEGHIINIHGDKVAAFRDENDELYLLSAICTHLKCVVHWNNAEKSWDCPCHGSRFGITGEIIEGPATHALKRVLKERETE